MATDTLDATDSLQVDQLIPVQFLQAGESAVVAQLVGEPEQVHRLEELGLRVGKTLYMVSPGSPCIVRLGHQKFSLRGTQAIAVLVRLLGMP